MSDIKTTSLEGDVRVSRRLAVGGKSTFRANATFDHDVTVGGWLDAPNIRGVVKGMYDSETALNDAWAEPELGWSALVVVEDTDGNKSVEVYGVQTDDDGALVWYGTGVAYEYTVPIDDINAAIEANTESIGEEASERLAADTSLQEALDAEVQNRQSLADDLATETSAREDTDERVAALETKATELEGKITDETTAREAADTTLSASVGDLDQRLTDLEGDVETYNHSLETADGELAASINTLDTRVTTLETGLAAETTAREAAIADEAAARELVNTNLQNEVSNRETADAALEQKISDEATNRANEDAVLAAMLQTEGSDREAADTTLTTSLNTEIAARKALNESLNDEITNREDGDSELGDKISALSDKLDSEIATREANDSALGATDTALSATDTALSDRITALSDRITAEATVRETADSALENKIAALDTVTTDVSDIQTDLSDERVAREDADTDLLNTVAVVNVNKLCGDADYTLATALEAIIALEGSSGKLYCKEGLVITFRTSAANNTWSVCQYMGLLADMTADNTSQWSYLAREATVTELAERVTTLEGTAATLESDLSTFNHNLEEADNNLDKRVTTLETTATTLEGKITDEADTRQAADAALTVSVDDLGVRVGDLENDATALYAADTALGERVTALATTVENHTSLISDEVSCREEGDASLKTDLVRLVTPEWTSSTTTLRPTFNVTEASEAVMDHTLSVDTKITAASVAIKVGSISYDAEISGTEASVTATITSGSRVSADVTYDDTDCTVKSVTSKIITICPDFWYGCCSSDLSFNSIYSGHTGGTSYTSFAGKSITTTANATCIGLAIPAYLFNSYATYYATIGAAQYPFTALADTYTGISDDCEEQEYKILIYDTQGTGTYTISSMTLQ